MNSFLNSAEIAAENIADDDITFLKKSSCITMDNDESPAATKLESNVKVADGDSKTTSYYSRHQSWKKKSFADIVRKSCDAIENPRADSCGDIGNETCSASGSCLPTCGQLFASIDNISVRSVLENLFKEPVENSEHQLDDLMKVNYAPRMNETSAALDRTHNSAFDKKSSIHVESILKNIFHEGKSCIKEETNENGNVFNFRYNLSDLLYERPKSSESSLQPSTYFVCPRCGEVTNLETNDLEGLGSVGDRCLTNFRRYRKGQKTECGNRRNDSWTPDYSWGGRSRYSSSSQNPFSGLNQKKRNRYSKEPRREGNCSFN